MMGKRFGQLTIIAIIDSKIVRYKCDCGIESNTQKTAFTRKNRKYPQNCKTCANRLNAQKCIKDISGLIFGRGCKVIGRSNKNKHGRYLWLCKCKCGQDMYLNSSDINKMYSCRNCYAKYNSGPNHVSWNPELTDEDRKSNRTYLDRNLVKSAFKRDYYHCQLCGDNKYLNAHHLNGYNWAKEQREDLDNLITLCEKCHKLFHKLYGTKDNTSSQFSDFFKHIYLGEIEV